MTEFNWPDIVPPGQRSIRSNSSMLRKNMTCVMLSFPDGREYDLLNDEFEDEITRMSLLCAVCGTMSGARNYLHAGLIVAAVINATDDIKPNGKYSNCIIQVEWSSSKLDLKCSVENLMDLTFLLSKIILDSDDLGNFNVSSKEKKEEIKFDPTMAIGRIK